MAYLTVDRELVDPDFHDGVVRSFMDDLPLQTVIGRIKAPIDITQDVEVEALPSVYDPAIAEGQEYDKTGAIKKLNPVMTEVIEQFRSKGWRVSRLRQKLPGHNEKKGQTAANKRAADARDLAAFERKLAALQADYRANPTAFDELFAQRPFDVGGSMAYRWHCTLKRLAACDPHAVAEKLAREIDG